MAPLRGFLDRVFRRRERDVTAVAGPTRVKLECSVASPNIVESPVSGMKASLLRWSLLEERSIQQARDAPAVARYDVLAIGFFGVEEFLLEAQGLSIEIPLSRARFAFIEDPDDGQLLGDIPDKLADVVMRLDPRGPLAYREAYLLCGDAVELTATLERIGRGAGYRTPASPSADLRALPDERILIRDLGA